MAGIKYYEYKRAEREEALKQLEVAKEMAKGRVAIYLKDPQKTICFFKKEQVKEKVEELTKAGKKIIKIISNLQH